MRSKIICDINKCDICYKTDREIIDNILNKHLPIKAYECGWSRICQVRGRNLNRISNELWREVCTDRGFLRTF